jgi:hypothetical protein
MACRAAQRSKRSGMRGARRGARTVARGLCDPGLQEAQRGLQDLLGGAPSEGEHGEANTRSCSAVRHCSRPYLACSLPCHGPGLPDCPVWVGADPAT